MGNTATTVFNVTLRHGGSGSGPSSSLCCPLLHQERTSPVDCGQGPLHLWMLSLNALDFWQIDRISEEGSVDLLVQ